ncbi:MAG: hypothetical protein ABUS49_10810 [Acidobacteriota bacterium]
MCDTQSRVRTQRLIWLLAAVLSLGSLEAAQPTRLAPFAQIRPAACAVARERRQERACQFSQPFRPFQPAFSESSILAPRACETHRGSVWFVSRFRFQLPPPALAS